MANMFVGIISITVGAVLIASVFISTVKGTNTTGWSTGEVAVWNILTIVGALGLVYGTLSVFGLA